MKITYLLLFVSAVFPFQRLSAQANYDESKVPKYELPKLLQTVEGKAVSSTEQWKSRRAEILSLFSKQMYGAQPSGKFKLEFQPVSKKYQDALKGLAIRQQVQIVVRRNGLQHKFDLLIYLPKNVKGPVPVFVGYNFHGNQTVHSDRNIKLASSWVQNKKNFGSTQNKAVESSRGKRAYRWPVEQILKRGYGIATVYYGDVVPDYSGSFDKSVIRLFYESGQKSPKPDQWAAISAWAWGLSRVMDYFETDDLIDHKRVAVIGHSRLGKTALWTGATDERFAAAISNNSGCGGAALSRRAFGETVARINQVFPHWFCGNFNKFNNKESDLPFDQHMLIALMAPRPVYVASATGDRWADPKGEFLSALHAEPAYKLFDKQGLGVKEMPQPDKSVGASIGYHIRTGKHDIKGADWKMYMDFLDRHFKKKK